MKETCREIFLLLPLMINTVKYTNAVFALNRQSRDDIVNVIHVSNCSKAPKNKFYLHQNINVDI